MKKIYLKLMALALLSVLSVTNAWATTSTIYVSGALFSDAWDSNTSEVKIGYNYNPNSQWTGEVGMTKTEYTYEGYPIYSKSITSDDNAKIFFYHYKNGSKVSTYEAFSDGNWVGVSSINNKLYIGYHSGQRWVTLCHDATIYFVKNGTTSSWGTISAYGWNSGWSDGLNNNYSNTPTMTRDGSKTYNGADLYYVTFNNPPYSHVLFKQQASDANKSGDQTISGNEGKIFDYAGNTWHSYAFDHTATVSAGSNGDVSPKGSGTVIYVSGRSITATPDEHYVFDKWTASGGGISPTSSTTNPQTFTATSDGGTITASFSDRWVIAGIAEDGSTTPDFGYYRGLPNTGTNTHSTSFILAEGDYKLKIFDRKENEWYTDNGATINRANNSKTADDVNNGDNMTLHVDLAGSYTFTFNTSSKLLTVSYPTYTEALSSMTVTKAGSNICGGDGTTSGNAWKIYTSQVSSANLTMTVSPTTSAQGGEIKYAIGSTEKGTVSDGSQTIAASDLSLTESAVQYTFKAYFKKGTYQSTGAEQTVSYYIQKTSDPAVTLATQINSANASDADLATEPTISLVASVTNNLVALGSNFTYYVKTPGSADWEVVASSAGTSTTYTPEAIGEYKFKVKWTHQRDWESSEQTFVVWKNYTIYVWDPSNWAKYVHIWKGEVSKYTWGNASEAMTSKSGDWGTGWYSFNIEYPKWTNFKVHLNDATSLPQSQSVEYAFTQEPLVANNNVYFRCTNKSDANWLLSNIEEPQMPEITLSKIRVYANKLVVDVAIDNHYSTLTSHSITINGETPGGTRTGSVDNVSGGTYRYTLNSLEEDTEFAFRVSATNGLGTTNYSESVFTLAKAPIKMTIKVSSNLMKNQANYWGDGGTTTVGVKYWAPVDGEGFSAGFSGTHTLTRKAVEGDYWWYECEFDDSPVSFYMYNDNVGASGTGTHKSADYNNASANACTEVQDNTSCNGNHCLNQPDICGIHYKMAYYNGRTTTWSNTIGDASDKMSLFIGAYNSGSPAGRTLKIYKYTTSWDSGTEMFSTAAPSDSAVYVISLKESADFENATTSDWDFEKYSGNYYIRTDKADGGWNNYKGNSNLMTYSDYSAKLATDPYTHYWMKWVQGDDDAGRKVKFEVANDYNNSLSNGNANFDTDDYAYGSGEGKLKQNANVRFMYNANTNKLSRAYLRGSSSQSDRFLVLKGDASNCLYTKQDMSEHHTTDGQTDWAFFKDDNNWVYQVDVYAKPNTYIKLTADFTNSGGSNAIQYFKGSSTTTELLIGGTGTTAYPMRVIYDFKINRLVTAWLPSELSDNLAINADVMLIRNGQDAAQQITLNTYNLTDVHTVYAVMQFNRWRLNNRANPELMTVASCAREVSTNNWVYDESVTNASGNHPALEENDENWLTQYQRDLYWISFPFDVNLNEVFGSVGTYGTHWIIEYYDGKGRAQNGFWADSPSNWKFINNVNTTLKAYEGYILALDLDYFAYNNTTTWANNIHQVELYFPSGSSEASPINITTGNVDVEFKNQSEFQCHIDRRTDKSVANTDKDRRVVDSYWHCIGTPSFHNVSHAITTGEDPTNPGADGNIAVPEAGTYWTPEGKLYLYEWNSDNTLSVVTTGEDSPFEFKSMWSYLVQYSGASLSWTSVSKVVAQSVAARVLELPDSEYCLKLMRDSIEEDHTYVRLTDDVNVTTGFEFNYDLCKEKNSGKGNIWTVTTDVIPVAGNSQPHPLTTTVVPVGVKIAANGEYTFSMPEGTNGGDVWLIDNANSSRTNLGLMDYTVNLTTGTYEGRFSLEFPVQNVVTEIENAANANANADVRKVFVGGRLYILRDGKAYDATGAQVR